MAERLVVMNEGAVCQLGTQQDLYERPADRFVAGFVGRSSFIEGRVEAPGRFVSNGGLAIACSGGIPGQAALALRPERLVLGDASLQGMDNALPGVVEFVSYLGASLDVHVRLSPEERVVAQIPNRADGRQPKTGDHVVIAWPAATGALFAGTSTPAGST